MKEKAFVSCTVIPHILGGALWYHKDTLIFRVNEDGKKEDLRKHPPYLPMSPCPYCGASGPQVANVSAHDPLKHVHPELGTSVNQKDS